MLDNVVHALEGALIEVAANCRLRTGNTARATANTHISRLRTGNTARATANIHISGLRTYRQQKNFILTYIRSRVIHCGQCMTQLLLTSNIRFCVDNMTLLLLTYILAMYRQQMNFVLTQMYAHVSKIGIPLLFVFLPFLAVYAHTHTFLPSLAVYAHTHTTHA